MNAFETITEARAISRELMQRLDRYRALRRQYDALGGAAWLGSPPLDNGLSINDIISAIASLEAIDTFVTNNNHDDVLYKAGQ